MDYTKLDGADLLHAMGDNASKWAAAFCQLNPDINADEDTLMMWFANAIEHSNDLRTGRILNGDHAEYLREHAGNNHG